MGQLRGRQRFADKLEADADEGYRAFKKAWLTGDYHASRRH